MNRPVKPVDPLLSSSRREALIVFAIWLGAAIYTVTVCYYMGYGRTSDDLHFVLGIPDWVFWGIVIPWMGCLILNGWFSFWYMTDGDLEQEGHHDTPESGSEVKLGS